eukprot:15365347-Ditylum_brightwellii.AAC.1
MGPNEIRSTCIATDLHGTSHIPTLVTPNLGQSLLNSTQKNYAITEREFLAIVEILKEFKNIPLGKKIRVYTNHKNIMYKNFNTARFIQWHMILEDHMPKLIYIPGDTNSVADMLSCLDNNNGSKLLSTDNKSFLLVKALMANNTKDLRNKEINSLSEKPDNVMIAEYYIDNEDKLVPPHIYPLNFKLIQREHQKDKAFLEALKKSQTKYDVKEKNAGLVSHHALPPRCQTYRINHVSAFQVEEIIQ